MNKEPIFLDCVTKTLIWGTEQWGISAHSNGDAFVKNPEYNHIHLSELWESYRYLFGDAYDKQFPLLTKIIRANDDLSIQVHPDDAYAEKNEKGSFGKTECWYIMDCKENATIIIGHNASTKEELKEMIDEGRWNEFIKEVPIHKGDFFFIPPGTVHAIKGGTVILETQQSSDITYRVYDYDRLSNGRKRELHINQSLDVINVPHKEILPPLNPDKTENWELKQLCSAEHFTVWYKKVEGDCEIIQDQKFMNVSVISGEGYLYGEDENKGYPIKIGSHFILPFDFGKAKFIGDMELILSTI